MLKWNCCALVVLASLAQVANALEISSGNFSMGYGVTLNNAIGFTTTETSSVNTPDPSPGQFAFTYGFTSRNGTAYQGAASSNGVTFGNRILSDGAANAGQMSGWSPNFQFSVDANYLGALPANAAPGSAKLRLNIDSVSVYGFAHTAYDTTTSDMHWTETTVLNPGSGPSTIMNFGSIPVIYTASSYTQVAWDPNDFLETGLSSSRTFVLDTINGYNFNTNAGARVIDGFEIFGSATLTYELVAPEPSSALLLGLGLVTLSLKRRKRTARTEC